MKTVGPFHTWAIDTVGRLKPPDKKGNQYLIVCVDVFTKWIEYGLLKDLNSLGVAQWFHKNITLRFGTPF